MEDVLNQFDKTRTHQALGERYAHGGGLLQWAEWIRPLFWPPNWGLAGSEKL
jgi:hypothetical protein